MVLLIGNVVIFFDKQVANGGGYRVKIKWRAEQAGSKVNLLTSSSSFDQTYGSEEAAEHDRGRFLMYARTGKNIHLVMNPGRRPEISFFFPKAPRSSINSINENSKGVTLKLRKCTFLKSL